MGNTTTIGWTERSYNPIRGGVVSSGREAISRATGGRWVCKTISPGCDYCYASTQNRRYGGPAYGPEGQPLVDTANLSETILRLPLVGTGWRNPAMIFLSSMTDIYGDWVPQEWLDRIYAVLALTPHNVYQVLTKRPQNALRYLSDADTPMRVAYQMLRFMDGDQPRRSRERAQSATDALTRDGRVPWPLPNVWQGVSVETNQYLHRVHTLMQVPAALRFISAEPLLGPLPDLGATFAVARRQGTPIDWLILGGESAGPAKRAMVERCPVLHSAHPLMGREGCGCNKNGLRPTIWGLEAAREIRDTCRQHEVALFFKQWGGFRASSGGNLLDGRTWNEMPDGAGGKIVYDKDALVGGIVG